MWSGLSDCRCPEEWCHRKEYHRLIQISVHNLAVRTVRKTWYPAPAWKGALPDNSWSRFRPVWYSTPSKMLPVHRLLFLRIRVLLHKGKLLLWRSRPLSDRHRWSYKYLPWHSDNCRPADPAYQKGNSVCVQNGRMRSVRKVPGRLPSDWPLCRNRHLRRSLPLHV